MAIVGSKTMNLLAALVDRLDAPAAGKLSSLPTVLLDGTDATKVSEVAAMLGTDSLGAALYVLEAKDSPEALRVEATSILKPNSKQLSAGPDHNSNGIMIALKPSPADAKQLALTDGLPPDELHCTILYLGKVGNWKDDQTKELEDFTGALLDVAGQFKPFTAKLNGITRFSPDAEEDELDPLVVNVDAPEIEQLRVAVNKTFLTDFGRKPVSTHGFTPHMTVGYLESDDEQPIQRWVPRNVQFDGLYLSYGFKDVFVPFGDDATESKAYDPKETRDPHSGKWIKVGEAAIPEGHVRLFHYTPLKNVDSIRKHGLLESHARGDGNLGAGNEPSAGVWASTKAPEMTSHHKWAIVEYHAHPDEISQRATHPHSSLSGNQTLEEWQQGNHHVIMRGDVKPDQIVAIHEPWHAAYDYMASADDPLSTYSWVEDDNDPAMEPYRRAYEALKHEQKDVYGGGSLVPGPPSGQLPVVLGKLSGETIKKRKRKIKPGDLS